MRDHTVLEVARHSQEQITLGENSKSASWHRLCPCWPGCRPTASEQGGQSRVLVTTAPTLKKKKKKGVDQAQGQLAPLRQGLDAQGQEDLKPLGPRAGPWASDAYRCPQEDEGLASCKVLMFGNILCIRYAIGIYKLFLQNCLKLLFTWRLLLKKQTADNKLLEPLQAEFANWFTKEVYDS